MYTPMQEREEGGTKEKGGEGGREGGKEVGGRRRKEGTRGREETFITGSHKYR